jgi:hypothetical protein
MEGIKWYTQENSETYSSAYGHIEFVSTDFLDQGERIRVDDALRENLIEVVQTDNWNGIPQVRITNHSSWKITLLQEREFLSEKSDRTIEITITLQHNASAVLPASLLSSCSLLYKNNSSVQDCLHYFNTAENQAGMTVYMDDRLIGTHYGKFPLEVEVKYGRCRADA